MKYLIFIALLGFFGWLAYRHMRQKIRQAQGHEIPVRTGPRPVTVLAAAILLFYGGYLVWRLIQA